MQSTITHAMCLACNGTPRSLSRANDLSTFVKNGTSADAESYVEVDILKEKSVATVRRSVTNRSFTLYYVRS
jgi:hypothetical protein